jgi:hypothetical protein
MITIQERLEAHECSVANRIRGRIWESATKFIEAVEFGGFETARMMYREAKARTNNRKLRNLCSHLIEVLNILEAENA